MITFGISTKNRLPDLQLTLRRLIESNLNSYPLVVIDDGSQPAFPSSLLADFPHGRLIRHDQSKGYVLRRHEIAMMVDTPYYFSLDDDSSVASGDIAGLLAFLRELKDWICVGFPISLPDGTYQVPVSDQGVHKCRTFVGCAHVLNLEIYKKLGGYALGIEHQGEEIDLSIRAFTAGYDTWHYPHLTVRHEVTQSSRNLDRMAFYGARNKTIFIRNYYAGIRRFGKLLAALVERLLCYCRDRRSAHLKGFFSAIRLDLRNWAIRPKAVRSVAAWENLPLY